MALVRPVVASMTSSTCRNFIDFFFHFGSIYAWEGMNSFNWKDERTLCVEESNLCWTVSNLCNIGRHLLNYVHLSNCFFNCFLLWVSWSSSDGKMHIILGTNLWWFEIGVYSTPSFSVYVVYRCHNS